MWFSKRFWEFFLCLPSFSRLVSLSCALIQSFCFVPSRPRQNLRITKTNNVKKQKLGLFFWRGCFLFFFSQELSQLYEWLGARYNSINNNNNTRKMNRDSSDKSKVKISRDFRLAFLYRQIPQLITRRHSCTTICFSHFFVTIAYRHGRKKREMGGGANDLEPLKGRLFFPIDFFLSKFGVLLSNL